MDKNKKRSIEDILKPGVTKAFTINPKKIKGIDKKGNGITGGLIIPKYCTCGRYSPKSLFGVIDSDCKNCGGKKQSGVYR